MQPSLTLTDKKEGKHIVYLIPAEGDIANLSLSPEEKRLCLRRVEMEKRFTEIPRLPNWTYVVIGNGNRNVREEMEELRQAGAQVNHLLSEREIRKVTVVDLTNQPGMLRALLEGMVLENYRFVKYITDKKRKEKFLPVERYHVYSPETTSADLEAWSHIWKAVYQARDLVNEPVSTLNAVQLAEEIVRMGEEAGFTVEVFNKSRIESLRMGGLLAVNKGSIDPPTFSILEWKPQDALNEKPIVLVGKGVVFDTGGLSLKPTKDSMDLMKSDMGGAAAVAGTLYALAANRIPVHVIGLIPATDNRPDGNAYAPGDIITMMDGTTVEVLNTDAEGRMILADALCYAKRYDPQLVVELSTLTGAAAVAIGPFGLVGMGNAEEDVFSRLTASGEAVWERVVQFPFWKEYKKLLKSEVADLKNIGGRDAGAITAGKFLEHFTSYPFIHLDIAGPAFLTKKEGYQPAGGTGVGVRLLYHFIREMI